MRINKEETYGGQSYKFKIGKSIGKGGNGEVFEANIINSESIEKYVVKFLAVDKWGNEKLKKRYNRFHKEINTVLVLQKDISGIMKIVNFHCPEIMQKGKAVWYLMKKAETFSEFCKINKLDLKKKIEYLLELANVLCMLHKRGYSHRDIKVDNLLVLENPVKLSDFELIWSVDDSMITGEGERLGPYYIGPPELESRDVKMDDFRASDVFLFAKVVWMVLKNDNMGFRGQYGRENRQFYLNPSEYGVFTFEPIHRLLEESTKLEMYERIDINKCREYLIDQLLIINDKSIDKASWYKYTEIEKEIQIEINPDEEIYNDFYSILKIIERFSNISNITIDGTNEVINVNSVGEWEKNKSIILNSNEVHGKNYLFYPDFIKYNKKDGEFELSIKKIERESIHSEFISYKESRRLSWGVINNNILLDENLVIKFIKK